MKRSVAGSLIAFAALSPVALAEEAVFDNFLLSSPSIISPSQSYQVKGGRFETIAGLIRGSIESKTIDTTTDISGTSLAVGYSQALSAQLVLAADADYHTTENKTSGSATEDSASEVRPGFAYSLAPSFNLGVNANIRNGKETASEASTTYSYTTVSIGGTLHQDQWESTLVFSSQNKDDENILATTPQALTLHGRYQFAPRFSLGARVQQRDFPGVQLENETLQSEMSTGLIVESKLNEHVQLEAAFTSVKNSEGVDGIDTTEIFLGSSVKITSTIDIGAQVWMHTTDAELYSNSTNRFALTITSYHSPWSRNDAELQIP